ncbi:SIR2 family NAD-dependent protein deacylase [Microcella alkaliphila]|uniref:SIR2 family NAD-dependent protein deacylase n=1 Tax=Microcella alkaliphila TaxID=279828 RepID=UPI001300ACC1|nr:SIR2 family protein [Microcella alkaliphila]
MHKHINLLDQPVLMTTNYDRLYERYWEQELNTPLTGPKPPLMVSTYVDNDVVDNLRSDRPLLLKLHGSVEKPRNLVLSRSQYSRAKFEYPNFFKVVSALLLTRTVLFVGCGFNGDPDIELLLEDSAFTAQSIAPHYAITPKGRHDSETRSIRKAFNVKLLEYDNEDGNHDELTARLAELSRLVDDARI